MTTKTKLIALTKPKPAPATLRGALARSARRAVVNTLALAAPLVAFYGVAGFDTFGIGDLDYAPSSPEAIAAVEESEAERMIERRGCWTGSAPEGVTVPGGVVLAEVGKAPRYYGSDAMVGKALDHIFTAPEVGIGEVFAFCP